MSETQGRSAPLAEILKIFPYYSTKMTHFGVLKF
jgi:hypothetical protein